MQLITLSRNPSTSTVTSVWVASLEKLRWQPWAIHNSITAAFAKAVWLGVSAPYAVEIVQDLCAKHHQPLDSDKLWETWFACVRMLNGCPDEAELEVA